VTHFLARLAGVGAALALLLGPTFVAAQSVQIPMFRDVGSRAAKPDLGARRVVRFLTASDWPPFQFLAADGTPAGYHADLARALCAELGLSCTLQAWTWDTLLEPLKAGRADAVIAGLRITPQLRKSADLTRIYFRLPARFATRKTQAALDPIPEEMRGRSIAVVRGTAHEAFLKAFFPDSALKPFADLDAARNALKAGDVDALFGDGLALALWIGGTESAACCAFVGGPYFESRYFGEGLAIAVRNGDAPLRNALDYALDELASKGVLSELYLRWFPVGLF